MKLTKFNSFKDEQLLNKLAREVTEDVSKLNNSKLFRDIHPENILFIEITKVVLKLDKSIEVKELQLLNK